MPLLTRGGSGDQATMVDVLYAPPLLFQVSGKEEPKASLQGPSLVFFMEEMDHDHEFGLTPEPPRSLVWLDSGEPIEPYEVTELQNGDDHRISQVIFPMPKGMSQEALTQGEHTLTFAIFLEAGLEKFEWQLPLGIP